MIWVTAADRIHRMQVLPEVNLIYEGKKTEQTIDSGKVNFI